ncbi:MAG TPA: hypothetical protein VGJ39_10230 [Vicinamibacterales bacterium]
MGTEQIGYCRDIERYLCQKNDGHLIRIAGPSFDLVSAWAAQGVPLKVAFRGIDRYFERYYAKGPRRRPVRIDFCEADVLDVFDEWRRATGVTAGVEGRSADADGQGGQRGPSLPVHMERVLRRLTSARVAGTLDEGFDDLLDRVSREMDAARGVRGAKRQALVERLAALDRELLDAARARLDEASRAALAREADEELAGFRSGMSSDALARARDAAIDRLVRERSGLPTIAFY